MRRMLLAACALAVAGCGARAPLRPPPGEPLPVAPEMAGRPLTSEELLTPPPIARPQRVDELLTRSQEREDDRFDLPPQ
jgi:predicted small lipoprotein YifL